ncbi:DNA repair protein RAD51 homolog 3 isoform X2 [Populus nigra]|uniref:DNA repair protein RAD51 homolog 3 isoform X2 n=1 Tax=Populus nigra TaxID=3691 RepID=UPI002B26B051|nr:DNA repair protein RAD51 homolog 3 isoform X2 [Populus nigra]
MDGLDGSNAILQQEQQQQSLNPKDWIAVDPQNAWDLLHEERSLMTRLTTSCADLDDILGGGISCKQVTEIGGVPGIGKTQLGIQLAVNVQMPSYCGGLGGKAIYIEGSFMGERAQEIAEACIEDISEYKRFLHKDSQACQGEIQGKDVLQNIYFFRICSYTEQIALINYLEEFISDHKDVKIVVIDSVAFHFRQGFEDLALRTRILGEMALKLVKLAKMCNLAVVLLNQVTTKYMEGSFQLSFSLGDRWSRCCTNRIILYWNRNERYAYIDKSPYLRPAAAPYSVTGRGIRNSAPHCKRTSYHETKAVLINSSPVLIIVWTHFLNCNLAIWSCRTVVVVVVKIIF